MVINISDDEYDTLLIVLGYATAEALRREDRRLANAFVRLANSINRDNPNWTPYRELEEV